MTTPAALEAAYKFFKMFPQKHVFHRLPVHYKKYLVQTFETPTPVHYIPEPKEWVRDPKANKMIRVPNVPIPLIYPKEADEGLWGGEAIIKGFLKRRKRIASRLPHWWFPSLKKAILYSEILDTYMNVVVTDRTLRLIDQAYGFDNYILQTPVQDLHSRLGLQLRRQMLLSLLHKTSYPNNPEKRQEIYEKYKQFIVPEEEVEWIGLSLKEAMEKQKAIEATKLASERPLKVKYRQELIMHLKEMKSQKASDQDIEQLRNTRSWLNRWNPFATATPKDEADKV